MGDFKRSNIWVTILVVAVVLLLLFVPEFVGFDSSITNAPTKFTLKIPKVASRRELSEKQSGMTQPEVPMMVLPEGGAHAPSISSLEKLAELVDQGYIDYVVDTREAASISSETLRDRSLEAHEMRIPPPFIPRDRISWDQLRSKSAQRVLREVQGKLIGLSQNLSDFPQSRFAVLNLYSGIESVFSDMERRMSAREVIEYLEHLDLTVTRTMLREDVPRAEKIAWSEISLAAVLGARRADRMKLGSVPAFNPALTLQRVELWKPGGRRGEFAVDRPAFVSFEAKLYGTEVKRVELYRNGFYVRVLPVFKESRSGRVARIQLRQIEADGIFELRIYDKYDNLYSKYYEFVNKTKSFPWLRRERKNEFWMVLPPQLLGSPQALDSYLVYRLPRSDALEEAFFASGKDAERISWWS